MRARPITGRRPILRVVASLWFAAVLLVLLLVAMACATVFESMHGTEQALAQFYRTWWFRLLLTLLAVNVAAAMVIRYPFSKRQIGFVVTHAGILITLGGALATRYFGVNGQVGVIEGQTVDTFGVPEPTLTMLNRTSGAESTIDLNASVFRGFTPRVVDGAKAPTLKLDNVLVKIKRYLPDSKLSEDVSGGVVKVEHRGASYDVPLEECTNKTVPLGDTGYTVRVLRYLPHATVGPDNKVVNTSNHPINPAIEVELAGPDGSEKRFAFARFPDFASMHGGTHAKDFEVAFVAPTRATRKIVPVDLVRETRMPAVLVEVNADTDTSKMWVQKYRPASVTIDITPYELVFRDKQVPLGFQVTLNRFRIGYYPGERRPRSFESQVTIVERATGRTQGRVISMNHPTKYGGYTLYQSSYRMDGNQTISYLSVARDPGLPIVFAGYFIIMAGMVVALITRIVDQRRMSHRSAKQEMEYPCRT